MKKIIFLTFVLLCAVAQGAWAQVSYVERSWDEQAAQVVANSKTWEAGSYTVLQGNHGSDEIDLKGNYVVVGDVTYGRVFIVGDCNIVLSDDCHLHTLGIAFGYQDMKTLNIYGQTGDSGKLTSHDADTYENAIPGIGHININSAGVTNIHGGIINATGGRGCPGIGPRRTCSEAVTNIYGGTITAEGWNGCAGIGGGQESKNIGAINIYGGKISAQGGTGWSVVSSAGIGGGKYNCPGTIKIYGGDINATGKEQGAGIGCGQQDMDYDFISESEGRMTIEIHGGKVVARGSDYAAGIGGGDGVSGHQLTISGGHVEAYGGTDAAGIGGGEGAGAGRVTITGGEVYAEGNDNGAGIGGGEDGNGGIITITGGTVIAKAGRNESGHSAIGPGYDSDDNGSLTIGDDRGVFITTNLYRSVKANRVKDCRNYQYVRINQCAHGDLTYTINNVDTHIANCKYCTTAFEPEPHTYENGVCTVCGITESAIYVTTEAQLTAALFDGANIILGADITISKDVTIDAGKSVTIDLYGHKLDRGLGNASTMGSGVIYIKQGGSLTINDGSTDGAGTITGGYAYKGGGILNWGTLVVNGGTISGNRAGDEGGGIFNFGTATINGGTISSNTALGNGGGISNSGTLTVNGGFIAGNTSNAFGGGISNGNTLNLNGGYVIDNYAYSAGGGIWMGSYDKFNVQGAVTVTGNTTAGGLANNVYFANNKVITVTGSLTGSSIGISTESEGKFTNGYSTYNSGVDPTTYFIVDNTFFHIIDSEGEAYLSHGPQDVVYYYERSWDDDNKTVVNTQKTISHKIGYTDIPAEGDYKEVTSASDDDWFALGGFVEEGPEYYVVRGNVKHNTLNLFGKNVHLILCDGAKLTLSGGILCYGDNYKLNIHSQSYGPSMGKLIAESGYDDGVAGIGSDCVISWHESWNHNEWGHFLPDENTRIPSDIEIHGGDIYAQGSEQAAGIGGGNAQSGGNLIIYGGKITAKGGAGNSSGEGAAGIGGGNLGDAGNIKIYGGTVEAWGGRSSAGIGGGEGLRSGNIEIYDGNVVAHGGEQGAGIGSGMYAQDITVTINGGIVKAYGNDGGAGIGSGKGSGMTYRSGIININGGEVYAYGSDDAAGIGGGNDVNGADVTITGGYVYAKGDGNGAGIGSGCEGIWDGGKQGGRFTMTGGEVYAYGGVDAAGIGGGEDADGGTVNISGGYVYAEGKDYGPGIGGGQGGDGGNVTITGGTVIAKAGANATGAIGSPDSDDNGSLTLGDDRCAYITNGLWRCKKENRINDCFGAAYLQISECLHGDATATVINGDKHSIADCKWCYVTGEEPHVFGDDSQCDACQLIRLEDEGDNSALFTKWADGDAHDFFLSGRKLEAAQVTPPSEGTGEA